MNFKLFIGLFRKWVIGSFAYLKSHKSRINSISGEIPKNYPTGCSSKIIKHTINNLQNGIYSKSWYEPHVSRLSSLIQLGQNELTSRFTKRSAGISILISLYALFIAFWSLKLTRIQASPILYEQEIRERDIYESCKRNIDSGDFHLLDGSKITCKEVLEILSKKFGSK